MGIKVKALEPGFYGVTRRRIGDIFEIANEGERGRWMGEVDDILPEDKTGIPFTSVVAGTASGGNIHSPPKASQPWEEPIGESKQVHKPTKAPEPEKSKSRRAKSKK